MTDNYGALIQENQRCSDEQMAHVRQACARCKLPTPKKHLTLSEFHAFMAAMNARGSK